MRVITMTDAKKTGKDSPVLASNRRARHDYHVLETIEAGVELRGTEVKSLRDGQASLAESYALVENGEAFLVDLHIQPYRFGNVHNHEPRRKRRLLMHRREIARLAGQVALKGQTLIPLQLYLKRGRVKVELALCEGKQTVDKRETIKRRDADRETARVIAAHRRR
jgi:SsrA-binding protein